MIAPMTPRKCGYMLRIKSIEIYMASTPPPSYAKYGFVLDKEERDAVGKDIVAQAQALGMGPDSALMTALVDAIKSYSDAITPRNIIGALPADEIQPESHLQFILPGRRFCRHSVRLVPPPSNMK